MKFSMTQHKFIQLSGRCSWFRYGDHICKEIPKMLLDWDAYFFEGSLASEILAILKLTQCKIHSLKSCLVTLIYFVTEQKMCQ